MNSNSTQCCRWLVVALIISAFSPARAEIDPLTRAQERRAAAFELEMVLTDVLEGVEIRREQRARQREALMAEYQSELDRLAELNARADAERRRAYQAAQAAEQRPGSGGTITKGGKTLAVPPTPVGGIAMLSRPRGEPPSGAVWVFPEPSMQPRLFAFPETGLTAERRKEAERASLQRVTERFPFLTNRNDSRRQQLDRFIELTGEDDRFAVLYSLTGWREYVADECALLYEWSRD